MTKLAPDPAVAEEGIAADLAAVMRRLDLAQQVGDLALRHPAADRARQQRPAALERPGQRVEHQRGDVRHARRG